MKTKLCTAEALMSEGGLLSLDVAAQFMTEGYYMNDIEDQIGADVEFEITPQLLENL